MNIFREDSKVWILDDICLWMHLCAGNPCETLMPVEPFVGRPGAATPGSNFEEALQKQLEVLKSELLQARGGI